MSRERRQTIIVDAANPMLDLMPMGYRGKKARELWASRGTSATSHDTLKNDFAAKATGHDR